MVQTALEPDWRFVRTLSEVEARDIEGELRVVVSLFSFPVAWARVVRFAEIRDLLSCVLCPFHSWGTR